LQNPQEHLFIVEKTLFLRSASSKPDCNTIPMSWAFLPNAVVTQRVTMNYKTKTILLFGIIQFPK